jgi:hypothetical protein
MYPPILHRDRPVAGHATWVCYRRGHHVRRRTTHALCMILSRQAELELRTGAVETEILCT